MQTQTKEQCKICENCNLIKNLKMQLKNQEELHKQQMDLLIESHTKQRILYQEEIRLLYDKINILDTNNTEKVNILQEIIITNNDEINNLISSLVLFIDEQLKLT